MTDPQQAQSDLQGKIVRSKLSEERDRYLLDRSKLSEEWDRYLLDQSKISKNWDTFFKITNDQLEGKSKQQIAYQNVLYEIVLSEETYIRQLDVLRILYRDDLITRQPRVIPESNNEFITTVFGNLEDIKEINGNFLLALLKHRQRQQGPWIIGFSDIFREWIRKAKTLYINYCSGLSYATYLVRREADRNVSFHRFLISAQAHKLSNRLGWDTYFKAPLIRLQRYPLMLSTALKNMSEDSEEKVNLARAIDEIGYVVSECFTKFDEQSHQIELLELQSKLLFRPGIEQGKLNLDYPGRKLVFRGILQRANAEGIMLETYAFLFDHCLILSKRLTKKNSGLNKEFYEVSKQPIPMSLLVLEMVNDIAVTNFLRSSVLNIGPQTTSKISPDRRYSLADDISSTPEHTVSDEFVDTAYRGPGSLFPFKVKHLGSGEVYTLYAASPQIRHDWFEKIVETKNQHNSTLFAQNAQPFRLRVIANTSFASPDKSIVTRTAPSLGTPLDRALIEIENTYKDARPPAAVCTSQVNCATTFNFYGKSILAIGTDDGVYTKETIDPRDWKRSIQIKPVTQITALEEFSLCLIIAGNSLIAYHFE